MQGLWNRLRGAWARTAAVEEACWTLTVVLPTTGDVCRVRLSPSQMATTLQFWRANRQRGRSYLAAYAADSTQRFKSQRHDFASGWMSGNTTLRTGGALVGDGPPAWEVRRDPVETEGTAARATAGGAHEAGRSTGRLTVASYLWVDGHEHMVNLSVMSKTEKYPRGNPLHAPMPWQPFWLAAASSVETVAAAEVLWEDLLILAPRPTPTLSTCGTALLSALRHPLSAPWWRWLSEPSYLALLAHDDQRIRELAIRRLAEREPQTAARSAPAGPPSPLGRTNRAR